jgi:glycosyltransferase involved in cell wall biosynthesis
VLAGPVGWGPPPAGADDALQLGYLAAPALRVVMAGAAALVLPSRYEGFGLPVLEALACGTPVVCSDLPALREAGGAVATYVPPGEPDALAAALSQVLVDDGGAAARAARRAWAAAFTWQRCAAQTLAVYASVA